MPILDYRCSQCQYQQSTFKPLSAYPFPLTSKCEKCGAKAEGVYGHNTAPSVGFPEIVVHFNKRTGVYSIPGSKDDPVDRGYVKVEIKDFRHYEKVRASVEAAELEKAQFNQAVEAEVFDKQVKEHRETQQQRVDKAISQGGYWVDYVDDQGRPRRRWAQVRPWMVKALHAGAQQYADHSREKRRLRVKSGGPNFHSRMLEHRESEQSIVSGTVTKRTFFT